MSPFPTQQHNWCIHLMGSDQCRPPLRLRPATRRTTMIPTLCFPRKTITEVEFTVSTDYPPPVDKLLTYGEGHRTSPENWANYLELGLGPQHVPDLIRMATDSELNWAEGDSLEVWAPLHAWRALGQLHAEAALEPLLSLFETLRDDEWAMEELPEVFGVIGPVAIPALAAYLADESHGEFPLITASSCLEKIATMHPEARGECVAALIRQLERFDENEPGLNAFLIHDLVNLKAPEAAPVIKQAFAADSVDLSVMGDWDEVQVELGLKSREEVPEKRFNDLPFATAQPLLAGGGVFSQPSKSHRDHAGHKKAKSKMAKESRKKNRKRK